jgi:regulator of sigma E protease
MFFIIFLVLISLIALIVLHELGHFILAKRFGVKVEEFGIGLPPRIFGKKIGETIFSLNLLPLGAFVKLYGEEERVKDKRSFSEKPVWQRALIVLGGVVSFWLISAILLSIVFGMGVREIISDEENHNLINPRVQIIAIAKDSPAEKAGLKIGDSIINVKWQMANFKIDKVKELQKLTEEYKGKEIILTIEREKEIFDVKLVPRVLPPAEEGPMGVALVRTAEKSYPWYLAPIEGVKATLSITGAIVKGLIQVFKNLVIGKGLPPGVHLTGPIGIGSLMTKAAKLGINYYLQFLAIISLYLAIFNILPIPALDGGKLLFLTIEKIQRKPLSQKIEQTITSFFFALLLALLIWVTIKDISQLWRK